MPSTKPRRTRKPITTRKATKAELDTRTGRERNEAAARKRSKPARRGKPRTKATAVPATSPHDFALAGVRFHNARQDGTTWLVDVSNGDRTVTLHNRHGSWMADVGNGGSMAEPARVARQLGADMTQLEMGQALLDRVGREMGAQPRRTNTKPAAKAENTTNHTEEATMARKPRSTATKPAATKPAASKPATNGRTAFSLTKTQAKEIAKRLRNGDTMKDIRTEFGHSDGSKVRAALREHGFGSKGQDNPDGLTPTEWRAKFGNGDDKPAAAKRTRTKAKAAEAEVEPEEDEEEDEAEAAEETTAERRARLRRERRAAAKAKPAARKRSRKPKAAAADPS
jgi:hypothetical protein